MSPLDSQSNYVNFYGGGNRADYRESSIVQRTVSYQNNEIAEAVEVSEPRSAAAMARIIR